MRKNMVPELLTRMIKRYFFNKSIACFCIHIINSVIEKQISWHFLGFTSLELKIVLFMTLRYIKRFSLVLLWVHPIFLLYRRSLAFALCASCLYWKIMSCARSEWESERWVIKFILDFIFISFFLFFSIPSYHIAFDATSAIQQYSGTNAEFTKADAVIFRSDIYNLTSGRKEFNFKRTLKYDSKWLDSKYFHHDETLNIVARVTRENRWKSLCWCNKEDFKSI